MTAALARSGSAQMAHLPPMAPAPPLLDSDHLAPFVDPLPIPPVAKPSPAAHPVPSYRIPIREFYSKVHRDVPPTRFWGYGNSVPGPTIEVRSGEEILVEWPNHLPAKHFLPIDYNLMGAEKDRPRIAEPWFIFTAAEFLPRAMAGRRIGMRRASRLLTIIPTNRKPRCSGITTMPWASTGSTSAPAWRDFM